MRRLASYAAATLVGAILSAAPFLWYSGGGHGGAAHENHEARHGGQLGMVGEHHLELVRREDVVEVFVSDAQRRPVIPVGGHLIYDRRDEVPLAWERYRLVGANRTGAREVTAVVELLSGIELALTFDVRP